MRVFLSWSGPLSHKIAVILRSWLPYVIQQIRPYVSSEDIRKGNRWSIDIATELGTSNHGLICLTRDNFNAPWILFEAGALSKSVEFASLWTLLIGDLSAADVQGPLAQFQHTSFVKADFKRLIETMNVSLGTSKLDDATLDHVFERFWPELEESITQAIAEAGAAPAAEVQIERSQDGILSEVLDLVRSTARSVGEFTSAEPRTRRERRNFRTEVLLVPVRDHARIVEYYTRCAADPEVRKFGLIAHGASGIGSGEEVDYVNVYFQSGNPLPKAPLLQAAAEMGLEVIDILYERLVFKEPTAPAS